MDISANNLRVASINNDTRLYHKIYSEGNILLQINAPAVSTSSQMNIKISNKDTVYIVMASSKVDGKITMKRVDKNTAVSETRDIKMTDIYFEENVNFPYNPITSKKIFKGQERTGTGFLLSKEGYILTNYHVVEKANQINVKGVNGNKKSSFSASIILKDEVNDLAIIKLDDRLLLDEVPFSIKPVQSVIGEKIFVLGYPLTTTMGDDVKITDGIISSKNGYEGNINSYQISAPVQPGNSGGPLFDELGNLVGIINAKHTVAENASYAIKAKYLIDLLDSMDKPIKLPEQNLLVDKAFPDKVAALQNFVYIIEVK